MEDFMRDYSFGNFLNELRLRRGLTQYQLGALVGVSDKAVSKWENGSAKPQSRLLYQLGEVLGVSVDELLSCKYASPEKKGSQGVFAMKKQLWKKALDALHKRYGTDAPLEIKSRFWAEQAEMQDTDMIVYLDLLATLSKQAKKDRRHIRIQGGIGASFIAYLLGATDINPLKPHYYCLHCHRVSFDNRAWNGWDLVSSRCHCGKNLVGDGHNLPFETYRGVLCRNIGFDVSLDPSLMETAIALVKDYFKNSTIQINQKDDPHILTITVTSGNITRPISFCQDEELARYRALETETATAFDRINFSDMRILQEFQSANTEGIREFQSPFVKSLLKTVSPKSFADLIQIPGFSHGSGVWRDNAEVLVQDGIPAHLLIAYREDVFNYVQDLMLNKGLNETGLAYKVTEDTRRGIYSARGIPDEIRKTLLSIGGNDRFITSVERIRYLFPKAHGIAHVETAIRLMWYKLHYPEAFSEIMI